MKVHDWIKSVIVGLGYPGLAMLMLIENLFPPIPSELIMPLAGFFAAEGALSIPGVILAGTIGSVVGAIVLYYVGKSVGLVRLRAWAERYGRWFTVSAKDVDRSQAWFERHGAKAVFFARMVPGLRSIISIPAGVAAMPMVPFLGWTTLGSVLWCTALTLLGVALEENYTRVEQALGPAGKIVLGLLGVGAIAFVVVRKRRQKLATEA